MTLITIRRGGRQGWAILMLCLAAFLPGYLQGLDPSSQLSQYGHTAWRLSDGVFGGAPGSVTQTADGYLWVGTASGLLRFDGVRFVRWNGVGGVNLPHGGIHALFTARDGSLWIGAGAGLSHLKDGVLFNYASSVALVFSIAQDAAGSIWAGRMNLVTGGGLCKVEGTQLDCIEAAKGFPFPFAEAIVFDHQGNLWSGEATSVIRWKRSSQTIYAPELLQNNADYDSIGDIAIAPDGTPLIGYSAAGKELGLQEIVDGVARPYPIPGLDATTLQTTRILFDREGALWLGTTNGIYRIYRDRVDHYTEKDGLSGNAVSALFEDQEGDIWVVTQQGLDRLRDLPVRSFGKKEGLTLDAVQSLFSARDGSLRIVNGNSMDVLQSGKTISIQREERLQQTGPLSIIAQDHAGVLWLGQGSTLVRFEGGVPHAIKPPAGSATNSSVVAFAEDPKGDMWAAFQPNREIWRVHGGIANRVMTQGKPPNTYDMAFNHKGVLWIGDQNGNLAWLNGTSFEHIPFPHRGLPRALLQLAITEDDALMGTTAGGVILYKDGNRQTLSTDNGLPCENLRSFVFDLIGNLWLSSECGIMEVSREDWANWRRDSHAVVKPQIYDALDGARFTEGFLLRAAAVTPDGRIWFADGNELQLVDPAALAVNRVLPAVHLEEVLADGKSLNVAHQITMPALTRQIELDYTATSLSLPQRVQFRYKLEGHDKDWQVAGTRRAAFYNNLRPGGYRFRVMACNNSGLWNETGSSVDFEVAPAWFQTKWFIALCCLVAGFALYGFYRVRMRQLSRQMQVRYEARLGERTRLARDLHDTLLQTVQGTKLVAEQALQGEEDATQLQATLQKIHGFLSRAVAEGRAALTALRSTASAEALAARLEYAAEEACRECGLTLHFNFVGNSRELSEHAVEEVFSIGYEALRNACAHAKASTLHVELLYGKQVVLKVRDNGVGIDPEVALAGRLGHYGLQGMRERAARLRATLEIAAGPGGGTEIILSVPGSVAYQQARSSGPR